MDGSFCVVWFLRRLWQARLPALTRDHEGAVESVDVAEGDEPQFLL